MAQRKMYSVLQLVVARLRVDKFSFERLSNKLHMETTMDLSTGRGPVKSRGACRALCAPHLLQLETS